MEELIGKCVMVVFPCLNTPPEKKLQYVAGIVETIEPPMMKLRGCKYTHLEGRVWDRCYETT